MTLSSVTILFSLFLHLLLCLKALHFINPPLQMQNQSCAFASWALIYLGGIYRQVCPHNDLHVCLQDVGNVRGTTAVCAAPRHRLCVTSALARSAGSTRRGCSPPPPSKAVPVAPVTTPPVPWAPTPAWPCPAAPPWAPSTSRRSRRRASRLQSDTSAPSIPHPPEKCAPGLWSPSVPKQWPKGYSNFFLPVRWVSRLTAPRRQWQAVRLEKARPSWCALSPPL